MPPEPATSLFGSLDVVVEVRCAEAAAAAARAVPGVARLQPGVVGLLMQFVREGWQRATGLDLPDIAGVQAELEHDGTGGAASGVAIDVRVVVRAGFHTAAVAVAVQEAVVAAVPLPVSGVAVHVVDVELHGR
ncbi:hypothetical protein [Pseudonocardia sp. GCM10023141]|uniref:hypothetical protein n=1 Tax=Pseudonocardia sp. GCM10023141 TaxID=3252653 RepID=UPI0036D2099E